MSKTPLVTVFTIGVLFCVVAALQPAQANCPAVAPRLFNSGGSYMLVQTPGYVVSYTSPYANSVSANLDAGFWAIGFGDPDTYDPGGGADNGTYPALGGSYGY